jgi:iron complex outermembrane recepter protein
MDRSRLPVYAAALLILACIVAPSRAWSQTPTGTLSGVVVDQADAVVPDVAILLVEGSTALKRETKTNAEGAFTFPLLPPGTYTLRATRVGFAPFEVPAVVLNVTEPVVLRIQLKVEGLSEAVVVTAQKREERLQDVPIPVSVISADRLIRSNQLRVQDYVATVPGLNIGASAVAFQPVSIRGVTTGANNGNPKVGILIDDVPFGASTHRGGGLYVPDIDPNDLSRIEVLRGPQGTLYGASSLGGLVKYVTTDPSTDTVHGNIQTGLNGVAHGSDAGYNVRGSVNLPLSDTFALAGSGFSRKDSGYLDNRSTGERDINDKRVSGGRLATMWRPSAGVSLKLSALYQKFKSDGPDDVPLAAPGDLETNYLPGYGGNERKLQLYSATFTAPIAGMKLTSVTGYGRYDPVSTFDNSAATLYRDLSVTTFGPAFPGVVVQDGRHVRKFSQELRLSVPLSKKLDWLVGGFYTHENAGGFQNIPGVDPATGTRQGDLFNFVSLAKLDERAVFTDLTYTVTDRFDIQAGLRHSDFKQRVRFGYDGPFVPAVLLVPAPLALPIANQDEAPTTYLLTPRFRFSPDLMLYARVASGYGAGGITIAAPSGLSAPYGSEKTLNYELGFKGDFLDHRTTVDLSIYHIDYKDLQIALRDAQTNLNYVGNGGEAKSQGVELSISARPWHDFAISGWVSYDNAVLTEKFPNQAPITSTVIGNPGDRLPAVSRWSGYLSVEQGFAVSSALKLTLGGAMNFVGERLGQFISDPTREVYPAYNRADLYTRLTQGSWSFDLFVNNVSDSRGILWGDVRGGGGVATRFPIQPRTFGLSLTRAF